MEDYSDKNIFFNLLNNLDIIHSHGYFPDKYMNFINNNIVKITTIHCLLLNDYIKEYGLFKGTVGAIMHFYYLRNNHFNKIVGCSDSVKKYLAKFVEKESLTNINNGVNQDIFKPISIEDRILLRKELGFKTNETIFIFAGRFIKRKNVSKLIDLFNQWNFNNSKLLLLGEGDEENICKEKAKNNPNILLLGFNNTPEKFYQIADFVISVSSAEGYPMSILEAVSCGCYAYLSDIPSHREFIENNPSCGNFIENISDYNSLEKNRTPKSYYNLSAQKMSEEYTKIYIEKL